MPTTDDFFDPFAEGSALCRAIKDTWAQWSASHWPERGTPNGSGSGRVFLTPHEWNARGERVSVGPSCVLVLLHDGGDLSTQSDYAYDSSSLRSALTGLLDTKGFYFEELNCWATGVYRKD